MAFHRLPQPRKTDGSFVSGEWDYDDFRDRLERRHDGTRSVFYVDRAFAFNEPELVWLADTHSTELVGSMLDDDRVSYQRLKPEGASVDIARFACPAW